MSKLKGWNYLKKIPPLDNKSNILLKNLWCNSKHQMDTDLLVLLIH